MPETLYSQLSTPDLEALRDGRLSDMSTAGLELLQAGESAPAPAMPMPGLGGVTPSRPLAAPSGGYVTPGQIGTFAAETGPVLAGQTLGAMAGAATGPMAPVAVPVLSGAGAVAGKWVGHALLGRGMPSPEEQAAEFKAGAMTEAGGQLVTRGLPLALRTLAGAPDSAATREAVGLADKYGIPLTGGQATSSPALTAIEHAVGRFPLGGSQPVVRFGETQRQAAAEAVRALQRQVGGAVGQESATGTGKTVGAALDTATQAAKAHLDQLYAAASQAAGGATIPGTERIRATVAYLAREGMVPAELQSRTGMRVASAAKAGRELTVAEVQAARQDVQRVVEQLTSEDPALLRALDAEIKADPSNFAAILKARLPNADRTLDDVLTRLAEPRPMTFAQTRELEHRVSDAIDRVGPTTFQGKQLIAIKRAIRADINEASAQMGGDFAAKLQAADRFAADEYFARFGPDSYAAAVRTAAKEHPEHVVARILNSDAEGITQIKRILGQHAPALRTIQSQVLQDLGARAQASVEEVGQQVGQRFSVAKWLSLTEGADSPYRMDRLKALLDPPQVEALGELNRLFRVLQKTGGVAYGANPSGTAGGALSAAQLLAVLYGTGEVAGDMARGDVKGAGTDLAKVALYGGGPAFLAKVLLSEGGRDLIARGTLRAQGWAAKAARVAGAATRGAARTFTEPLADAMVTIPPGAQVQ